MIQSPSTSASSKQNPRRRRSGALHRADVFLVRLTAALVALLSVLQAVQTMRAQCDPSKIDPGTHSALFDSNRAEWYWIASDIAWDASQSHFGLFWRG